MQIRLKKFTQLFSKQKLDAYLVVNATDIRYLTGFPVSDSWLLVTSRRSYFITDARYTQEARKVFGRSITVKEFKVSLAKTVLSVMKERKLKQLGFDERYFSVAQFKAFKRMCSKDVKITACNGLVQKLRLIKDSSELRLIRQCLKINLDAYRYLKKIIKPGMTEREVFFKAESFVRSKEVRFSFLPIIASGPNSAFPHAKLSKRQIRTKDLILIDLGIHIKGYKSDLTRIFVSSKITEPMRVAYLAVAEAQQKAIAEIRAGVSASQVDAVARKSLKKNKLDRFFTHSLGHGVGMDVHESPHLSQKSNEVLKTGMVVTVEPGVYFSGKFGIRIEDMVLVKENGCEILSRGDKVEEPFYI